MKLTAGIARPKLAARLGISVALAALGLVPGLSGSLVAHALTTPATCATLTAVLGAASAGDVVVLSDPTPPCAATGFTLPAGITLMAGTPSGQGFNSPTPGTRILTGSATGTYNIQGLLFENSSNSGGNGGAIDLPAATGAQILNNTFLDNSSAGVGGAVNVAQGSGAGPVTITGNTFGTTGHGNTASYEAGAIEVDAIADVTVSNNTFTGNSQTTSSTVAVGGGGLVLQTIPSVSGHLVTVSGNTFTNNSAHPSGGGATIDLSSTGAAIDISLNLTGNTFRGNQLTAVTGDVVTHLGGGLVIERRAVLGTTTQSHNVFDGNTVPAPANPNNNVFDYGGGGEWISGGTTTTSLDDTFINNVVQTAADNTATGVGGGLAVRGQATTNGAKVLATNLVAGGNTVGTGGEGAGIYAGGVGCGDTTCPAEVDLNDSTVVSNTSGGTGGGIQGDVTDTLKLANDIVMDNTGTGDSLTGFGTLTTTYTDACKGTAPYAGTGNTCAEPKLASVTPGSIDVHETSASPTIDKGLNSLVTAGVGQDYFGATRIQGAAVDMGAAEFAFVAPVLPAAGSGPGAPPVGTVLWLLLLAATAAAGSGLLVRSRFS